MAGHSAWMFSLQLTNDMPQLMLAGRTGSNFLIDYSEALQPVPNWQTLTDFTLTGATRQIAVTPQNGNPAQFYRAVITP
jgi:hypothetical protein